VAHPYCPRPLHRRRLPSAVGTDCTFLPTVPPPPPPPPPPHAILDAEKLSHGYPSRNLSSVLRQAYANSLVDHHLVLDLLPGLAGAFFARRLPASLTYGQARLSISIPHLSNGTNGPQLGLAY